MNKSFSLYKLVHKKIIALALLLFTAIPAFAQKQDLPKPAQEMLLNGLKLLTWRTADSDKVTIKIRIHSGSAFDPQDKEGVMALLSENLFPTSSARELFVEELGGNLEIVSNYDYIQINAAGKSDEFLTMLQTLANAVSNVMIDKDTTAKLKAVRLEKIKQLENDPAYIADRAAAKRLLGTFPYGRPSEGTTESLKKIDFADLIFARDRFLTADNATIAVIGNVRTDFTARAVKRFFGGWRKSENRVPSTFRQPDEPDTKLLEVVVNNPAGGAEMRYAMRGLARSDKDFPASEVFSKIMQNRLRNSGANGFVRHEEHILPGLLILGFSSGTVPENGTNISQILSQPVTSDEFTKAKAEVLSEYRSKSTADLWFDAETYRLSSVSDEANAFEAVSLADVQRAAERLAKNPLVSVAVKSKSAETTN